jgi:hypothetical protein
MNVLLAYWAYHIDLGWFQRSSTSEILVSAPELCAELTAGYARRLHDPHTESPFDQDVEIHFTCDPSKGGENPTSKTADSS